VSGVAIVYPLLVALNVGLNRYVDIIDASRDIRLLHIVGGVIVTVRLRRGARPTVSCGSSLGGRMERYRLVAAVEAT